ncbi:hypothetical protein PUN4_790011 [Paraburkholderia unamae]|nr:hypothetical protein PUN4_790011 [Paraburkholderia unamae]
MAGRVVKAKDRFVRHVAHRLALQKVVDFVVADSVGVFVRMQRAQRLQIRRRRFVDERRARAQRSRERAHAAFVQARERQHVGATVAELREKPHQRLRCVIRADHEARARAGYGVLRDHPLARLDVAVDLVLLALVRDDEATGFERGEHRVGGGPHVDAQGFVRGDESERRGGVRFVALRAVGQAHGDEACRAVALRAQAFHGQLREAARRCGVHAAADAEHERAQAACQQALREEAHAALDLGWRVEAGCDVEFGDDCLLAGEALCGWGGGMLGHGRFLCGVRDKCAHLRMSGLISGGRCTDGDAALDGARPIRLQTRRTISRTYDERQFFAAHGRSRARRRPGRRPASLAS